MTEPTFAKLLAAAAFLCECEPDEILGDVRSPGAVRAREIVTLAMHGRGLSYPEIAAWFGRHSHSAFIYLHRRAVGRLGDAANQLSEAINA